MQDNSYQTFNNAVTAMVFILSGGKGRAESYSVKKPQLVEIIIYDILGNQIRTLFNGFALPGLNRIRWNGENNMAQNVNSDVYIYRIISSESVLSGKIVLNK